MVGTILTIDSICDGKLVVWSMIGFQNLHSWGPYELFGTLRPLRAIRYPSVKSKRIYCWLWPDSSLNGFKKVSVPWFDCFSSLKSGNDMWLLVTMCKLVCGSVFKKPLYCISNCSGHSKTELQTCKVIFGLSNDTVMLKNSVYACERHYKLGKNSCTCWRSE